MKVTHMYTQLSLNKLAYIQQTYDSFNSSYVDL